MTRIEIRTNDDGTLDEVCAQSCAVHLEQLDTGHWWLCVEKSDGQRVAVWLRSRGAIKANFEVDGEMQPRKSA